MVVSISVYVVNCYNFFYHSTITNIIFSSVVVSGNLIH